VVKSFSIEKVILYCYSSRSTAVASASMAMFCSHLLLSVNSLYIKVHMYIHNYSILSTIMCWPSADIYGIYFLCFPGPCMYIICCPYPLVCS